MVAGAWWLAGRLVVVGGFLLALQEPAGRR